MRKILLLLVVLSSCAAKEDIRMQTKEFGAFTIDLPATWKINDVQGIDSYVREIITGDGDTIHIDYGYYSSSLDEDRISLHPKSAIPWFLENKIDTTGMVFIDKEKIDSSDREKFRKQKEVYDTIDTFSAKIVAPRVAGTGLTGVYFDSLGVGDIGNIKLQISGNNLKPKNSDLFLQSLKTITIKENNSM